MKKIILAAALLGSAFAAPAMAADVVNGSFEAPVVNNFSYAPDPNTPTTSFVSIAGIAANGGAFGYTTPFGNQVGFLQGNATTFGTITQVVSNLIANSQYILTFFSAQRTGFATLPISVSFDNTLLGVVTPTSTNFTANSGLRFTATGTEGTLTFNAARSPGDTNAAIDNISVAAVTAAVPEPATWGMMILGFGAMGVAMRRRAKVRTNVSFA